MKGDSKPLEEVCNVEYGTRVVQKRDGGKGYPVYGGGGATFEMEWFNREDRLVIARFGISEKCTRFVSGKFFLNDSGLTISPKNSVMLQRFLDYQVLSLNNNIYALGKGTAQKNLDVQLFRALQLYVPHELHEQQRIVDLLDKAFEVIATTKANAEKNLQNARAVFESHLHSFFIRRSNEVSLSELASEVTDGDHSPPPKAPSGVPFITISDIVKRTREVDFSNTFSVPEEYFKNLKPNKKPRVGDILYTVTGATLGIPVLVKTQREFCFQRHIGLIRPKPETYSAWLTYALLSPQVFRQASLGSTGAAQKTVSLAVLRSLKVPKVSLPEQRRIAEVLDALSEHTQRLAEIYERKLTALQELKQSLLHQAFAGKI